MSVLVGTTVYRVNIVKTEPRCKICRCADREAIDELLLRRSKRQKDGAGVAVTTEYVLRQMTELGVDNPTKENLTNHWKGHCEVLTEEDDAARQEAFDEVFGPLLEGGATDVDVDAALKAMFKVGLAEFARKVRDGKVAISPDQMVKISDALARRKQSDAQRELLGALSGGISVVTKGIAAGLAPGQLLPPGEQTPDAEVVVPEGEVVEVS